ncbi:uncharacterized protein TRAVEDRAFT_54819 [Trametes versicolor FP-101664 SS1]|uniref:Uncharacterized protein n=1 Tax=Trametes versicolor (strain FP-101664) TaxID=717944 RepID=R7S895_TRAVS|nr:uncharacterized protein TRAVEDRAFT_54819 [Trametes versicolor FP-101664 SS1]EIW51174.1 hypothetical protein TRAVEDRAFT_54819 [Trametes versicolor FP-101664 SS1]
MPPVRGRLRIGETLGDTYESNHGRERGSFRDVLTTGLVEFTHDTSATMHWAATRFRDRVFVGHRAKLMGWPPGIEFANMSNLKDTPTAKIRMLLEFWENGWMYWAAATPGEVLAAQESVYNALPGALFPNPDAPVPRAQRSDVGAHRARPVTNPDNRWPVRFPDRHGAKSDRVVGDEWLLEEAGAGAVEDVPEEIEDTDEWEREAWRTRRLPSGELADDLIEEF